MSSDGGNDFFAIVGGGILGIIVIGLGVAFAPFLVTIGGILLVLAVIIGVILLFSGN